jgi:RNA polymerase sigma-70 factor (ECF subfamily)
MPEAIADSSAEDAAASERALLVRRALELVRPEFQERSWTAAWRVVVEGESPADVATALGLTAGAVYTAKSRVLGRLRELLSDLLGDAAP